ncbi:hypothetical protein JKY72_02330 [Candidatus Gracilibacteria bacterium]|nr:hypothetical protein [Candidatus Gracilibacteria bacterium]
MSKTPRSLPFTGIQLRKGLEAFAEADYLDPKKNSAVNNLSEPGFSRHIFHRGDHLVDLNNPLSAAIGAYEQEGDIETIAQIGDMIRQDLGITLQKDEIPIGNTGRRLILNLILKHRGNLWQILGIQE